MSSATTRSTTDTPLTLPFVGRDRELEQIAAARTDAIRGRGRLLLLSGEGGVGKTRLIEESARAARADGWQFALGHAYPLETAVPYASFADALGPVLAALDPGLLMRLTRGDRALVAAIAPNLAERAGGAASLLSEGVTPAEQRVRLHAAILQLLTKLAERQPMLICLENLQWADSASVELLHVLGRQLGPQRVVMIASWNETDRELPDDLRLAIRSLRSMGAAIDLRLMPLAEEQVRAMLSQHFSVDDPVIDRFAARRHSATQGNAFFIDTTRRTAVAGARPSPAAHVASLDWPCSSRLVVCAQRRSACGTERWTESALAGALRRGGAWRTHLANAGPHVSPRRGHPTGGRAGVTGAGVTLCRDRPRVPRRHWRVGSSHQRGRTRSGDGPRPRSGHPADAPAALGERRVPAAR